MKKTLALAAMLTIATSAGCGDDDTGPVDTTDPALLGAVPATAFAGRTVDVVLVGEDTGWTAGATPDFGTGITVDSTSLIGTGAIVATITIAPDAALGQRDITVTGTSGATALMSGFELAAPITVEVNGSLAQGSLAAITVTNNDMSNPFDNTSTGDGLFSPITFTNFVASAGNGVTVLVGNVTPSAVTLTVLTDVTATAGSITLDIKSGPAATALTSLAPLEIAARTPTTLVAGTPATGTVADTFDSLLFEITPSVFGILDLAITTTSDTAGPQIAVLGASGNFDDMIGFSTDVQAVGDAKVYVIVWENAGESGYDYSLGATDRAASKVDEAEPNENSAAAQALASLPGVATMGNLSAEGDQDWFQITIAAGDIGKAIHVATLPGDPNTDTVVEVFESDGTTSFGGPSADRGTHEDHTTPAITAAGTYYVMVTGSVGFFDAAEPDYRLLVELVTPPAP